MSGITAIKNDEIEATSRRRLLQTLVAGTAAMACGALGSTTGSSSAFTVLTFGDSMLDCARYNEYGVHPGQLIVRNNDSLFPGFKGRDLSSRGHAQLDHRAQDGGRVDNLPGQARGV